MSPLLMEEEEQLEEVKKLVKQPNKIRNVSVVGHTGHGKSMLVHYLARYVKAAMTSEAKIGFTSKSSGVSVCYDMNAGDKYFINLMDFPGNIEFSAEVAVSLRITDGALFVVDCVEGVSVSTENVLRQSMAEKVRPVLILNKMDLCFSELQIEGEDAYQMFTRIIESANVVLSTHGDSVLGDVQVYPEKSTVAFSSALHGWAFTLKSFAKMYAAKFGVNLATMVNRLWGDNFFDPVTKKWTSYKTSSKTCKRGFVQFCYEPIQQIIKICMSEDKSKLWFYLDKLNIHLTPEEKELSGRAFMNTVMQKWLPASTALLEMMVVSLPSPSEAQKYRVDSLYTGPVDDIYAEGIRNCEFDGPLVLYISKMCASDNGKVLALGRVFSGKVETNMRVRVMGTGDIHQQGRKSSTSVEKVLLLVGQNLVTVENLICGNIVAIDGLDDCILKTASLTENSHLNSYPLRPMEFSVSPIFGVAVSPKVPSELPKLVSGLKLLTKLDPLVSWDVEGSREHTISGAGEVHVNMLLKELQNFMGGEGIETSNRMICFRETILNRSSQKVVFSSKAGHLHLFASPVQEELCQVIDRGYHTEALRSFSELQNIWLFEPQTYGPNILWDSCKGGCEPKGLVKDLILEAFKSCANEGALASEKLRGIAFEICDFSLQPNACKMLGNQIRYGLKRAFLEAQLTANPRLQELVQVFEIKVMEKDIGAVYALVGSIKGHVLEETQESKSLNYKLKVEAPLRLSFDLYKRLNEVSSGRSFLQLLYQYWRTIPSDPLSTESEASQLVTEIRRRKGLKKEITSLKELHDNYSGAFST